MTQEQEGVVEVLLVWGWRVRRKFLGGGTFHCPNEGGDRAYKHVQGRRWFTIFWIPVIPLKVLGDYIECEQCGATYETRVLELPTTAQMEDFLTSALRHMIVAMLHADDEVHDAERDEALRVMARFGHGSYSAADLERDLEELNADDVEHELVKVSGMLSSAGQEAVVRACLTLAAADGHVDERELDALTRAGRAIGMSPAHIKGVLHEVVADT